MRKKSEPAESGILSQLPSVDALEGRLTQLMAEAARVKKLLETVRAMTDAEIRTDNLLHAAEALGDLPTE